MLSLNPRLRNSPSETNPSLFNEERHADSNAVEPERGKPIINRLLGLLNINLNTTS